MSGGRLEHALAAFLRQEFGASVAAIIGFLDILIEDTRRDELADFVPDLERMRAAGAQLAELITQAVQPSCDAAPGAPPPEPPPTCPRRGLSPFRIPLS